MRRIRRRRVTFLLPSGNIRSRASSQWPYSARSVSMRRAAPLDVPRGSNRSWNSYSGVRLTAGADITIGTWCHGRLTSAHRPAGAGGVDQSARSG
jgi:hypothetical protein